MLGQVFVSGWLIFGAVMASAAQAESTVEVIPRSEIQFQPLNPARGDASPKAGVLWGDIGKDVPSGALIEFVDGFSSPPHIHNITYRAVVISGAIHNDDPAAEKLWMEPGSFWTQPAGESHITAAAMGSRGTAFLEIMSGPYLVKPSAEAFDNGERPVNLEARNVVWLDASDVTWIDQGPASGVAAGAKVAFLWGGLAEGQKNGTFLKLPAGSSGELGGNGSWLRAVVIQGQLRHPSPPNTDTDAGELGPGSYLGSKVGGVLKLSCVGSKEDCLVYVSTEGRYRLVLSDSMNAKR